MLYNQNKACVKWCLKTLLYKETYCFPKKNNCFPTCALFSSPEHEVLMVSYCGQWLSVVVRRPSCVVRRPSTFDVYTLETTFVT